MRIHNLQALRGVACLLVCFVHLAGWECIGWKDVPRHYLVPFLSFGFAGVDLFFVLSGFVITWVNLHHLGDRSRLAGYLGRRLWRIYPLYWILWCAAFILALDRFAPHLGGYFNRSRLARFLLLVPNTDVNSVLPQAWTLCFEIEFYLIFALFFVVPRRWFVPVLGLWLAATVGACFSFDQSVDRVVASAQWLVHPRIVQFILGCLVAVIVHRGWIGLSRTAMLAGGAGFAISGLVVYLHPTETQTQEVRVLLFTVPAALLVFGATAVERTSRWVMPAWLQFLGEASYSIYLAHVTAFELLHSFISGWLRPGWGHLAYLGLMFAVSLAAGILVHFTLERPLLRLFKQRRAKSPSSDRDSDGSSSLPFVQRLTDHEIVAPMRRSA